MATSTKIEATAGTMILYHSPRGFANEATVYIFDAADQEQRAIAERMLARYRNRDIGDSQHMYVEAVDEYERRVYGRRLAEWQRTERYVPIDAFPDNED